MDKKSVYSFAGLLLFMLLWQYVVTPNLPDEFVYRETPGKERTPSSDNIIEKPSQIRNTPENSNKNTPNQPDIDQVKSNLENSESVVSKNILSVPEKVTEIETDDFLVKLSNIGGRITYLALKNYHPTVETKDPLILLNEATNLIEQPSYKMRKNEGTEETVITYQNSNETRIYTFKRKGFFFNLSIEKNNSKNTIEIAIPDIVGNTSTSIAFAREIHGAVFSDAAKSYSDNSAVYAEINNTPISAYNIAQLNWAGFRNKYFAVLIEPSKTNKASHALDFKAFNTKNGLSLKASGSENQFEYSFYAGPIKKDVLYTADKEKYVELFNYTGFDVVIHFLLWLLDFYNSIPGVNMGIAIILLTISVKAVLFPLNVKAQSSMFMMSKLGPKMKELQAKFKDDRQQLGVAQMKLFKENGVNPMAGCLPMVVQMPVFISLFSTIGEGFALRHAPFIGWIHDLSAPDGITKLSYDMFFIGNGDGTTNVNILVLLYVVTMLIQQSMMPKSTDPNQQQMQKSMKFMMIFFAVLLYNYSSGLMLYFVASNTLGMAESWFIKSKVLPKMNAKKA